MNLDSPISDVVTTPKAYAQTRQPDRHDVQPVLRPSSSGSVASSTSTWFLTVFIIFVLSPLLSLAALVFSATIFGPTLGPKLLEECLVLLKTSPLGATVIAAYFMVLLAVWGEFWCFLHENVNDIVKSVTLLFPNVLPLSRVLKTSLCHFRYYRSHISHMRLDHLTLLVKEQQVFTVFVVPPSGPIIPLRKDCI
jgi:hypothetical protein